MKKACWPASRISPVYWEKERCLAPEANLYWGKAAPESASTWGERLLPNSAGTWGMRCGGAPESCKYMGHAAWFGRFVASGSRAGLLSRGGFLPVSGGLWMVSGWQALALHPKLVVYRRYPRSPLVVVAVVVVLIVVVLEHQQSSRQDYVELRR